MNPYQQPYGYPPQGGMPPQGYVSFILLYEFDRVFVIFVMFL